MSTTTQSPATTPQTTPPEPPRRPWWMAKRVAIAAIGVILLSGAATAVLALGEVNKVVEALNQNLSLIHI